MTAPLRGFLPDPAATQHDGKRTKTVPPPENEPVRRTTSPDPLWLMVGMMAIFFALMALVVAAG